MANYVQVPPDSTGKKVDAVSLDVGADTVLRQRIVIGDNSATAQFATVTGGALTITGNINVSAMPAVVLAAGAANIGTLNGISATVTVIVGTPFTVNNISAAVVLAAGTANIGAVSNAAGTALMGAVSLAAGTANIGFINNISAPVVLAAGTANIGYINAISATVVVSGAVSLAAGTNVIGDINNISRTVQVAIGTPFILQGISTTVNTVAVIGGFLDPSGNSRNLVDSANLALRVNVVAGAGAGANPVSIAAGTSNIGFINNISATVIVAGVVSLGAGTALIGAVSLAAGTANIGFINAISATVLVAGEIANGSSLSTTNKPVLIGGNTSAGGAGGLMASLLLDTSGRIILAAGTNNIGAVSNAAGTALMGAVSLAAGTANIGFINNISATLSTVLAAGTANIGTINNISAAIVLAAGTANIGAVSVAAGTALMGAVSLAAGTANIGFLNNISATVNVVLANTPILGIPSASHGPVTITVSTSAAVVLITAPQLTGATPTIYITQLVITNAGTVSTLARLGTSASPSCVLAFVASAGGGAVINFDPPWKFSASATAIASVKPNSSGNVYIMANFFVQ